MFLLKNYAENVYSNLVPDPFLKLVNCQNQPILWAQSFVNMIFRKGIVQNLWKMWFCFSPWTQSPFSFTIKKNKRGLELVPTPFLGFKTYLKLFFMQRSIIWPILIFWLDVVSEFFRKTFLLIYASHLMMS